MKQQIAIQIQPLDNGFNVNCQNPNTTPQGNVRKVALTFPDAAKIVTDFLATVVDSE